MNHYTNARIMRFLDLKRRSDDGEETAHGWTNRQQADGRESSRRGLAASVLPHHSRRAGILTVSGGFFYRGNRRIPFGQAHGPLIPEPRKRHGFSRLRAARQAPPSPCPTTPRTRLAIPARPDFVRKSAMGLGRFRCFKRTQRSFRWSHSSRRCRWPLQAA